MNLRPIVLLICFSTLSAFAPAVNAQLRTPHRSVVEAWLATKPGLRLATEKDCQNKEGLAAARQEQGQKYQPYYAIGDFNRDGREDFAVGLIDDRRRSRKFAIAIFNGPFAAERNTANFFSAGLDLSDGGLIVSGSRLLAGTFQSDNCVLLRPRGRTYLMRSCV